MKASDIVKAYDQGLNKRALFDSNWQNCKRYFDPVGLDVNRTRNPGNELDFSEMYDSNSVECADILAMGLMNNLTPPTTRWFNFRTRDPLKMDESHPVKLYLDEVKAIVQSALNNSNFYNVMYEFYHKSGVYGTSVLHQDMDQVDGIRFSSLDMGACVLLEDARGRVNRYGILYRFTARQAVDKFGDGLHDDIVRSAQEDSDDIYEFIYYVGQNPHRDRKSHLSKEKDWYAQWVDKTHKLTVEEGGYDLSPFMAHRFYKTSDSPYGRSPAMKALMDTRFLNAKTKTSERASMKATDPAYAVPDNAFILPLNANPSAINYYKSGRFSKDDIIPLGGAGNPNFGRESIDYSVDRLRSLMFTKVFQAFENLDKQMNNPEVYERIAEKMSLLGPSVGRFISDILDPVLHRTISLLDAQGLLPDPPQELLDDPSYEIEYVSKLALAQKNSELQSLQLALQSVASLAQISPEVVDKVDWDGSVDTIFGVLGAPAKLLLDKNAVEEIRLNRQQQQAEAQRAMNMQESADIANKISQTDRNLKESNE